MFKTINTTNVLLSDTMLKAINHGEDSRFDNPLQYYMFCVVCKMISIPKDLKSFIKLFFEARMDWLSYSTQNFHQSTAASVRTN